MRRLRCWFDISFSLLFTLCLRRCRLEVFAMAVPKRKSSLSKCASCELLAILLFDVVFRDLLCFFFFFLKILRKIFILRRGPYECHSHATPKIKRSLPKITNSVDRSIIHVLMQEHCFVHDKKFDENLSVHFLQGARRGQWSKINWS